MRRAAVSLRKAVEDKLGVDAKIKTGSPGDFIVLVNGRPVFDHKKEGGVPETKLLLDRIEAARV